MEGGLDADSFAIRDASAVRAVAVTISLSGATGSARVTRSVGAASLKGGGELASAGLEVARLAIDRDLPVGSLAASGLG